MPKETKPEMTAEELAKKWGYERTINTMGNPVTIARKDEFLADLNSVIRGKLVEFAEYYNHKHFFEIDITHVEDFLSNNHE